MDLDVKETDVWVKCNTCGKKHQLKRGIGAPVYWCGDELRKLVEGDEVEYDDKSEAGGSGR